jgi:hypothetical protein
MPRPSAPSRPADQDRRDRAQHTSPGLPSLEHLLPPGRRLVREPPRNSVSFTECTRREPGGTSCSSATSTGRRDVLLGNGTVANSEPLVLYDGDSPVQSRSREGATTGEVRLGRSRDAPDSGRWYECDLVVVGTGFTPEGDAKVDYTGECTRRAPSEGLELGGRAPPSTGRRVGTRHDSTRRGDGDHRAPRNQVSEARRSGPQLSRGRAFFRRQRQPRTRT